MPGNRWRSRGSEGGGPGGARTSKARAGHRTRKACHRRWAACGKPQRYAAGRQIPPVRAGCLNWARPDLCGGRPVMAVPTRHLGGDDDEFAETRDINVTPFIDVILVLLIIFMVAAPLATVDVGVELPTSTAAPQPRP